MTEKIKSTPWDARAFGVDTYELEDARKETLQEAANKPGHFTVKVDPLSSKKNLHDHGFYYCDTLLKPSCKKQKFQPFTDESISLSDGIAVDELVSISSGSYQHGRFHRDFNVKKEWADRRYDRWLAQLYDENRVWGLLYDGVLAGFFAFNGDQILLQVLKPDFQGRGLSKYFWTTACQALFAKGHEEISTSISACNLVIVNLVTALGFRFKGAVDVYHKFNNATI